MSRVSAGSVRRLVATGAPGPAASERGRIATPRPPETRLRMRRLSLDSSAIRGSKPAPAAAESSSSRSREPRRKLMNGSPASSVRVDAVAAGERMRRRQHGDELLGDEPVQLQAAALDALGDRQEREVDDVVAQHLGELLAGLLADGQLDGGVVAVKGREQQREVDRAHRVQRADRQPPALHAGERLQLGGGRFELGEDVAGAGDEQLAGAGERDLARRALDERQPDLGLQAADLLGERGLGDVLARRRAGEVALVGERDEVAQLAKFHSDSL